MGVFNNSNNRSVQGSNRMNPSSPLAKAANASNGAFIIQSN
jgi:hypothetical protein